MKNTFTYVIIVITVFFSSCGIFKNSVKSVDTYNNTKTEETRVKTALDSIHNNYLVFETLYAGFTGNYITENQSLPLKGILKIKKDEFILISVRPIMGIEISRILITKDSIKIIDKLKNEYFQEDYSLIKRKFGFDLNFEIIQSILLNRFFIYPPKNSINSYFLINVENMPTLSATGIFSNLNISHKTSFSQNNYSVYENFLIVLEKNQSFNISYSDFKTLNNKDFPNSLLFEINEQNRKTKISLSYKNIKINEVIKSTFIIPENYKFVKFE